MEPIRSLDEALDAPEDQTRRRLLIVGGATAIGLLGLVGQLARLQIAGVEDSRQRADRNRVRESRIEPQRGIITDRDGTPLARNRPAYAVAIVLADLPGDQSERELALERLARAVNAAPADFIARARRITSPERFTPIVLRRGLSAEIAHRLEERLGDHPGAHVIVQPIREYPESGLTSHVTGYIGRIDPDEYPGLKDDKQRGYLEDDVVGKMGIESVAEKELRGGPGKERAEVDGRGRQLRSLGIDESRPGNTVELTIDLPFQREITRILLADIDRYESASVVALDPRNGEILAMVHLPSYDANAFARGLTERQLNELLNDPARPLLNGAIAAAYSPGSVFKLVTAIAALHENVVRADSRLTCTGELLFPNRLSPGGAARFPCWAVHGPQDCATALANSCNTFFYQLGGGDPRGDWNGVGIDQLAAWSEQLGLGQLTGIDLPGEVAGSVPTQAWKRRQLKEDWFKGDTYNVAIGQGFVTVTPIQIANLAAAIANGGQLFKPAIVRRTIRSRDQTGPDLVATIRRRVPLDADKLRVIRQGMRFGLQVGRDANAAIYVGTSWDADLRDVAIAGKTGSAEWGTPGPDGRLATHGWFAGYAPDDSPKVALSVFLKRGRGGHDAARVARRIFAYYFGVEER